MNDTWDAKAKQYIDRYNALAKELGDDLKNVEAGHESEALTATHKFFERVALAASSSEFACRAGLAVLASMEKKP